MRSSHVCSEGLRIWASGFRVSSILGSKDGDLNGLWVAEGSGVWALGLEV